MLNLREQAERVLLHSLEGSFGLPVNLITPDGILITTSENTGEPLKGQVLYDTVRVNPETGEDIIISNPVVVLRRSSLSRVPLPGETWIVKIPETPSLTAALENYVIDPTRPPEGGRSIGFVKLYLRRVKQIAVVAADYLSGAVGDNPVAEFPVGDML